MQLVQAVRPDEGEWVPAVQLKQVEEFRSPEYRPVQSTCTYAWAAGQSEKNLEKNVEVGGVRHEEIHVNI